MNLNTMNPVSALVIMVITVVVCIVVYRFLRLYIERTRNGKASIGNMLGEFYTSYGTSYEVLCETQGKVVKPPKERPNVKIKEVAKSPEGHGIGHYWIIKECCSTVLWPRNRPRFVQFSIKKSAWREGDPFPVVDPDRKYDDPEKVRVISSSIAQAIGDDNQVNAIQQLDREIFRDLKNVALRLKNIQYVLIGLVIVGLLVGVTGFLTFQIYSYLAG